MIKYLPLFLLLITAGSNAGVQVYGCAVGLGSQSDYCAPTPVGKDNVPGFDVIKDDKKVSVPVTTDPTKQPKATPQPSSATQLAGKTEYRFGSGLWTADACSAAASAAPNNNWSGYYNTGNKFSTGLNGNLGPFCCVGVDACIEATVRFVPGTCPTGYTAQGSGCNKQSDEAVPDNKQDIKAAGSPPAYTPVANDADSASPTKVPVVQPLPNQVVIPTQSGSGMPQQVTGTINPTGSTVQIQEQVTLTGGATGVKTTILTFDAAGNHIGTSVNTTGGAMTGGSTSGGSDGTYTAPSGGAGSGSSPFPNDYAKTGEAAAAASGIKEKLDTIHDDLTKTDNGASGDADVPVYQNGFGSTFTNLTGWQLPAHASACPAGSVTFFDHSFTFDSHCAIFDQVKPQMSVVFIAIWLMMSTIVVLRA